MSISWPLDVQPKPALLVLPPAAASLDEAFAAIELYEHYSRKVLDPTQRLTVCVMMAQRADGLWAAQTTGREMARQNGKGDEVEVVELWGLVQRCEAILHTIHDAVLLATQTQQRMLAVLEGHPDLRRKVKRKWTGTGQQMIEMRNGGTIWYRTRTGGGGRGVDDIDRLVIDEAQHATAEQLAAMTPTLLANANPQLNALGTAGLEGRSEWWWTVRKRALGADPGAFGYVGHTAEMLSLDGRGQVVQSIPADLGDRKLWRDCNPSLWADRGRGMAFFEEQYRTLGERMFAQEHLCVWAPEPSTSAAGPIDARRWADLIDGESLPTDASVRLAVDAPSDRTSATFAIAGRRDDGLWHVSVRYHVPPNEIGQVVAVARSLAAGHGVPLILPPGSPARAWLAELLEAGVEVDEMSTADYVAACGSLLSVVQAGSLRHRGEPELAHAVDGLAAKAAGDVEAWSRRLSSANIAPIVAATCALGRVPSKATADVPFFVY